jgi:hypothetical protein
LIWFPPGDPPGIAGCPGAAWAWDPGAFCCPGRWACGLMVGAAEGYFDTATCGVCNTAIVGFFGGDFAAGALLLLGTP